MQTEHNDADQLTQQANKDLIMHMCLFEITICSNYLVNLPTKIFPEEPGQDGKSKRGTADNDGYGTRQDLYWYMLGSTRYDTIAQYISNFRNLNDGIDEAAKRRAQEK